MSIFFNVKEKQQLYVTIHEFILERKKFMVKPMGSHARIYLRVSSNVHGVSVMLAIKALHNVYVSSLHGCLASHRT